MWPDNETERDFLNFTDIADRVSEIIIQAEGRPISIGVSGSWGVGKSSMIKLIRRSLEKRAEEHKREFLLVEFNAWLYQGYDDARAALLDVIATALKSRAEDKKTGLEKVTELLGRINWLRAAKFTVESAASLALGLPPLGILGTIIETGKQVLSGETQQDTVSTVTNMVSETAKESKGLLKPKKESSPPKEINTIRTCFEQALAEMDLTLVVLIDDLDRCLPETTISTLEAIRLFLFLQNAAFVIAADEEMIRYAVRRHFEGMEIGSDLVTNYFDKLIQVPMRVPPLGTQEVRAYMMLLFVENSFLNDTEKEDIRSKICHQLGLTWQGKRVDRSFLESIHPGLPSELIAKIDTAERLAPIMTTASKIAGNPRLIKRFLNALSIRMAIAHAHGVSVDEAVVAKMLLFERCADSAAYAKLSKTVNEDSEGKARFLKDWEEKALAGEELKLDNPWKDDFIREWLALPPRLADIDLRGVLYISREHAPIITPEDRLSSQAAELLKALIETPEMATNLREKLTKISIPEISLIMDRLLEKARQEQEWGTPPILEACLTVASLDTSQGTRIVAFLTGRPSSQIRPNIVPKISDQPWASKVFDAWAKSDVIPQVRKAITQRRKDGNLPV